PDSAGAGAASADAADGEATRALFLQLLADHVHPTPHPTTLAPPSPSTMLVASAGPPESDPEPPVSDEPAAAEPASAPDSPPPKRMIGVPTSMVWPSSTSSASMVPACGLGSSTSDFAVSISTRI